MENTTQTQINNVQPEAPVAQVQPAPQAPQEQPKKKGLKYLLLTVLVLVMSAAGYFGYKNPELFRATVIESDVQTVVPVTTYLYIPNYDASPVDSGTIFIKTKNTPANEDIVSMQFKLKYSPAGALKFNANSLVFDDHTLFKSVDLKSVDTSVPGVVGITFFSNTPASVSDNEQILVKLALDINADTGSSVAIVIEDLEVISKSASTYAKSGQFKNIASDKINIVGEDKLRVLNAEALDSTHVLVRFSDFLQNVGAPDDYTFDGTLSVTSAVTGYANGYDQKTVILETASQTAGLAYALDVNKGNIKGNTQGGLADDYRKAYFDGYRDPDGSTYSYVRLNSIEVKSGTEINLAFTGNLKASTVTPINIEIKDVLNNSLTVTDAEIQASASVVHLKTAMQKADANYFIKFIGVKDATQNELELVNNIQQNFFGYSVAALSIVSLIPSAVTNNEDQVIVVSGKNMDTVSEVLVGSFSALISGQTPTTLNFTVPKDFIAEVYDITFIDKAGGSMTLNKALAVNSIATPMRIVSEESKTIPYKVAPDGTTNIKFWVLVEDPVDLANVDSVTIDLQQIGGARAQEMEKDAGLQKKNQQFYTYTTTVNPNTPTNIEAYKLPVEVRKGSETAKGTVEIFVTKDILESVPPTVDQVYASPVAAPPDGKTNVKISAKVSDQDGADTIKSVVADLGSLGAGFVTLSALDVAGAANEQITGWYESSEFTIPVTTKEASYKITVTASDETGNVGTGLLNLVVSSSVTGPSISAEKSYISPRKSVPRDGKTMFSLNAMITDPDGVGDIDSVTAYFTTLGMKPVTLFKDPNASDLAKTALFASQDLTVPSMASMGVHEIQIIATDKSGGAGSLILQLDVTYKDTIGDAPIIFSSKSYTTPRVAVNDGQTGITLYAFVRDDDDDLESVVVNLSKIGQVGPETASGFSVSSSAAPVSSELHTGGCPTNSITFVCMQPSFKEGRDGQWFVLPGVTISTDTIASSEPYKVEVIATDKLSKVARGYIPVYVQDSAGYETDRHPPRMLAAVATAPGKLEVLFNKGLSSASISSDGKEFTITQKSDTSKKLNVIGATINADGNIVTLVTDSQDEGVDYVLTGSGNITDKANIALVTGRSGRSDFTGFTQSSKQPSIYMVSATDPETIYVEFHENIRPSSIKIGRGLRSYDVQVYESDNQSNMLDVTDIQFADAGNAIEIITSHQRSGQKYILQIKNVSSASGIQLKSPIAKVFKAVNVSYLKQAAVANQADLNGDGKVDFIDFTMFSAVYGRDFTAGASSAPASSGPSPIISPPDSTIPHTSEPAGGAIR